MALEALVDAAAYHLSHHRHAPVLAIRKTERKGPDVTAFIAISRRWPGPDRFAGRRASRR